MSTVPTPKTVKVAPKVTPVPEVNVKKRKPVRNTAFRDHQGLQNLLTTLNSAPARGRK